MKLIIIPSKEEDLKLDADGFILSVKDLSINSELTYTLDEIITIIEPIKNKDIFVSLNKNMHNSDLKLLEESLIKLDNLNIKGILYYDIAVVNLHKKLNLKTDLVWSQEHLTTNYFTCNYWYSKGVKYAYLSSEITIDEINEIAKNTKMTLMLNGFGHLPMFASKRPLVNNYLETFNIKDKSKIHYLKHKEDIYPLTYNGCTTLYSNKILNVLDEIDKINVTYLVLNSFLIDNFPKVLESYRNKDCDYIKNNYNTSKYFLYKETIYKVKK